MNSALNLWLTSGLRSLPTRTPTECPDRLPVWDISELQMKMPLFEGTVEKSEWQIPRRLVWMKRFFA